MRKISIALIFLLLMISAMCVSAEKLDVGTTSGYRPFVFYDYDNNLTGLDIDLLNEIGKREGFEVNFIDMAFDGLIDSLSVGQIDLIAGAYSITPERSEKILYSDPYFNNEAIIITAAKSNISGDLGLDQMLNYRFGVQRGSSFDQWIKTNLISNGLISTQNVFTFSTIDSAVKALINGSIDLMMFDSIVFEKTYKNSGNFRIINENIGDEKYAFAAAKESTELIERINQGIASMKSDGSFDELVNKYIDGAGDEAEVTITRHSQITQTPSVMPTPTPIPPIDQPANCKNVMVYMSDVSYPDGSKVNPGKKFTKTWQIYNNGSCKWYEGYSIVFTEGDYMSANSVPIPALTIPGRTVDVPMEMIAPQAPGLYVGYYQLRAPDGTFFGPKLTAKIIVTDETVAEPPVGAPPVITQWQPNYYKGDNGFCPTVYWTVRDAQAIHFSINQKRIYTTTRPSGSIVICPGGGAGDYVYGIVAEGTKKVSYVFTYTNTGGPKKQPNIPLQER